MGLEAWSPHSPMVVDLGQIRGDHLAGGRTSRAGQLLGHGRLRGFADTCPLQLPQDVLCVLPAQILPDILLGRYWCCLRRCDGVLVQKEWHDLVPAASAAASSTVLLVPENNEAPPQTVLCLDVV